MKHSQWTTSSCKTADPCEQFYICQWKRWLWPIGQWFFQQNLTSLGTLKYWKAGIKSKLLLKNICCSDIRAVYLVHSSILSKVNLHICPCPGDYIRNMLSTDWGVILQEATGPRLHCAASRRCPEPRRSSPGPSGILWTHWDLAYRSDGTGQWEESARLINPYRMISGLAHLPISVLSVVVHLGYVHQLHHGAGQRGTDMTWWRETSSTS